jgi:adenosylcobyric acid synthase
MKARALMFQGTGSDVGKSLIVAGLARHFANRGLRVRPFKPQNMSNNAAVTADGGEIGRAQALQARAARVPLSVHMNPVLLKPQSETGAQIIVQGRMVGSARAREFQAMKPGLMSAVLDSFGRLCAEADLVLVEGAGSASEVNLRAGDIANMGFARAAGVPVVLIGDIDRGGVIASLVGTQAVADPQDASLIEGFIVNKFRGDPAEDALALYRPGGRKAGAPLRIAVLAFPRIANFDDFDPLRAESCVDLVMARPGEAIPGDCDLVILPGSKATIADLAALRAAGWDIDLAAHLRRGGRVLGICGGYQMLGRAVADPDGVEGPAGRVEGLGLLDIETVLTGDKLLSEVSGTSIEGGAPFRGYEMHIGRTSGADCARPLLAFADGRHDGAASADGRVAGCYVHGLFADDRQRAHWLAQLGGASDGNSYEAGVDATLDALAGHIAAHVDCDRLLAMARPPH